MFRRRRLAIFRKGVRRYLILQSLSEKPRHGYEIMKSLSDEFGGIHQPSTSIIYPTLQVLEDEGYVTSEETEGKRIFSITSDGRAYLKNHEDTVKEIIETRREFLQERKSLNRELRNLASLIRTNYRDLEIEKADAIAQVLKETRRKINDIIFE